MLQRLETELQELKKKKVELLKNAKRDQKKYQELRKAKDMEIKTLTQTDRRNKIALQKVRYLFNFGSLQFF